jgi:hypothetical protein
MSTLRDSLGAPAKRFKKIVCAVATHASLS